MNLLNLYNFESSFNNLKVNYKKSNKLEKDKIPYADKRPFYHKDKFAKIVINKIEKNYFFINVLNITKVFLAINFFIPKVGDLLVERFSTWKKLRN